MLKSGFRNIPKCVFNDTGYCKYGDYCRKMHYKYVCNIQNCNGNCKSRHPKSCKDGQNCRFFSKKVCAYKHVTLASNDEENHDLKKQLKSLKMENENNISKVKRLEEELKTEQANMLKKNDKLDILVGDLRNEIEHLLIEKHNVEKKNNELHQQTILIENEKSKFELIQREKCLMPNLNLHQSKLEIEVSETLIKCDLCDNTFKSKAAFIQHKQLYHKKLIIQVESIPTNYLNEILAKTNVGLDCHRGQSEQVKTQNLIGNGYQCDKCDKILVTKTSLFEHRYRHCEICSNLCSSMVQLKKHIKSCSRLQKKLNNKIHTV